MCVANQETKINFENFDMLAVPASCHTIGSTLFYLESKIDNQSLPQSPITIQNLPCYYSHRLVFTGDTIFIGGCGKFFEGDGRDMQKIVTRAKKFHRDTQIFCGHDYTLANLKWAVGIEWENPAYEECLQRIAPI